MEMASDALHFGDHRLIAQQIRHLEFGAAGLAGAQQLARAADLQIALRDDEAIVAVAQHLQARLRGFAQRCFVQQHAV